MPGEHLCTRRGAQNKTILFHLSPLLKGQQSNPVMLDLHSNVALEEAVLIPTSADNINVQVTFCFEEGQSTGVTHSRQRLVLRKRRAILLSIIIILLLSSCMFYALSFWKFRA